MSSYQDYKQVQQEYLDNISADLAKRIDNEVMQDLLAAAGWTCVKIFGNYNKDEVVAWVNDNCDKNTHCGYDDAWAFKKASDATWFTIRWSNGTE